MLLLKCFLYTQTLFMNYITAFLNYFFELIHRLFEIFLPEVDLSWWLKVKTQSPDCVYYFGPFDSKEEAVLSQAGYLDDLIQEGAQNIRLAVEKARPQELTHCTLDSL